MFQQLFKKIYTISNQNHDILTKKMGEIDIFCDINTKIYIVI
jgi:hypothetical protein